MYRTILVPLDGSEVAECVLPYVQALMPADQKVTIVLLYIVEALDIPFTNPSFKTQIESEAQSASKKYLDGVRNKLDHNGTIRCEVIIGKPAESIIDYSNKQKIDLIIMATHGRSGIDKWIRGSVAEKVIHTSQIPVWLVPAACTPEVDMFNKGTKITLLVPLDGLDTAGSAIEQAETLTRQLGSNNVEIIVIRVCELFSDSPKYPPHMSMSWEEYANYETKRCLDICTEYVTNIEKKLKEQGFTVRSEVLTGNVADKIVDYANANSISVIVMSTHGRSGIGRWAFGSVTEKVLAAAKRPILLIRYR
ncbi:MAG TPA: hypothetical protein DCX22_04450 [Dehalococcoidia bacterium]|nr:hypothetical protein [Dehalococcoidia bacterium]